MVRLHGIPGVPGVPRYDDFFEPWRAVRLCPILAILQSFIKSPHGLSRYPKRHTTVYHGALTSRGGTGCYATDALKHTLIPWQNLSTVAGRDRT